MKKVALTTFFAIAIVFSSMASHIKPDGIKEIIQKEMSYPEFAKAEKIEGIVMVSFTVNEGLLNIETANASNDDLKEYVINKLKSLVFTKKEEEQRVNMKFVFKIL